MGGVGKKLYIYLKKEHPDRENSEVKMPRGSSGSDRSKKEQGSFGS